MAVLSIFLQQKYLIALNLNFLGCTHIGSLKSTERLACDIFDTSATHANLVHDITNTD